MIRPSPSLIAGCRAAAAPSLRSQLPNASARRTYAANAAGGGGGGSNLPLILGLAGLGGLGAWYGLGGFQSADKAKANAEQLKDQAKENAEKLKDKAVGAAGAAAGSVAGALDKNAFKEFTLKEIKPYNHDSATLVFELPDGATSGLPVTSAVLLKAAGEGLKDDKGKEVIRPYTPVSSPDEPGHIDFLIKAYENGNMSKHAHSLKPGDKIAIKGPIPKWPYKANEFEEIACVGGGSGVTPFWQLIQKISADPSDKTKVTLIYTNKSEKDILLREEFDRLAKSRPEQFKVVYGLDSAPKSWTKPHFTGYVTPELISQHLPAPGRADKIKIFVCGPPPQVEAISGGKGPKGSQGELKGLLADAGYAPSQIYKF